MDFFDKLKNRLAGKKVEQAKTFNGGLVKTRQSFSEKLGRLIKRYRKIDDVFFEELEDLLIEADVGVPTVLALVERLKDEARTRKVTESAGLKDVIVEVLADFLGKGNAETELHLTDGLNVLLLVGVNGAGKTTTAGKLAARLKAEGRHVLLAAADTFRAGAIEQLQVWGERIGVPVIRHQEGSDPAAVIFDALQAAKSRGCDVLICDTAGRLQNKVNLMNELGKIKRVIERDVPGAPQEVLLVVDATTGQNALNQAKLFQQTAGVTGIVLTKLDGTSKGGIVLAIRHELNLPVKFVGLGEQVDDLQPFDADAFVYGLFFELFSRSEA
ncbi:MAG: signal recognition particle-docking protein FtsY [Sporolactobacillus sp.]